MLTGIALVALAVICRSLSAYYQFWNLVPVGAIALYAGSRLPRRWAWTVPLAAMIVSDLVLDHGRHRPVFELTRWTVYTTLGATTLLGLMANRPKVGRWMLPVLSMAASALFFVTTNFATWAEGQLYPLTWPGLTTCFAMALPFFRNTLLADLVGTGLLFGLGPVFEQIAARARAQRVGSAPAVAELSESA